VLWLENVEVYFERHIYFPALAMCPSVRGLALFLSDIICGDTRFKV